MHEDHDVVAREATLAGVADKTRRCLAGVDGVENDALGACEKPHGFVPGLAVLWLPLLALLALVTALGVGTWAAAFNLQFRDVRYVVPFLVQLWLFATPIAYPSSLLPEPWRTLYAVNPMVGVVEGFRWALLGTATRPGPMIAVSAAAALAIFVSGVFYFRRVERGFADLV